MRAQGSSLVAAAASARVSGLPGHAQTSPGGHTHLTTDDGCFAFTIGRFFEGWQDSDMPFVADDLGAWLVGLLADTGRRKLTTLILGTDQERALRQAATAAVLLMVEELRPEGGERAEDLAMVVSQVFSEPGLGASAKVQGTLLETMQVGIAEQLAVLGDVSLTGTGRSSAEVLGVTTTLLTERLATHLMREIVIRGSRGGPLEPLAAQLNHDATHLQGHRLEGMIDQLANEVREALAQRERPSLQSVAICTLPVDTAAFTGREEQLAGISAAAANTPGLKPIDPADALATLLIADGVDPRYLPPSLDGRSAMWRNRLAGKRVLLILDNAASSHQVAPLLPGAAGCMVIVTSRRYLGDLPSTLVSIPLDTLPPSDALTMFMNLAPRARGESGKVSEMVTLCGHLPLAISLLAALFTRHRSWTMDYLIEETKAKLLTVGSENRTVAAAFELSYQYLAPQHQSFFCHLGLHPGPDIDPYATAALVGLPLDETVKLLDRLHRDSLLAEPVPGRYRMHNLIHEYARSLAEVYDFANEQ